MGRVLHLGSQRRLRLTTENGPGYTPYWAGVPSTVGDVIGDHHHSPKPSSDSGIGGVVGDVVGAITGAAGDVAHAVTGAAGAASHAAASAAGDVYGGASSAGGRVTQPHPTPLVNLAGGPSSHGELLSLPGPLASLLDTAGQGVGALARLPHELDQKTVGAPSLHELLAGERHTPLFTTEGPGQYQAALEHNADFAKPGPYTTHLNPQEERQFEHWVNSKDVPFQLGGGGGRVASSGPPASDYDMRGYWKATHGKGWEKGDHFPDTFKTPLDTTFSNQSKYAKPDTPYVWKGDTLVDRRSGQTIFGPSRLGLTYNKKGDILTPNVRHAEHRLGRAADYYRKTALPNLSGLSAAERRIFPYAERAHHQYPDVPVSVLMAQDKQESGFNPLAESSAGAFGTSQFIPSTAASYGVQRGSSPAAIQSQLSGQAHLLHDDNFSSDPQGALSSYSGGYAAGDYNNPILEDAKANYSALDKPSVPTPKAVAQYRQAAASAADLGIHAGPPLKRGAGGPLAPGSQLASTRIPYQDFGHHVARQLHVITNAPGYKEGSGDVVIKGHGGGELVRQPTSSSGGKPADISVGHDPEIAARLMLLSKKLGQPVYVISGYRTPAQSESVGGFPDDPHTKGEAMDIGVGAGTLSSAAAIPESVYNSVGLYRPFGTAHGGSSAEDNHVQLLNGGTPSTGSGTTSVGGATAVSGGGGLAEAVAAGGGTAQEAGQATHAQHHQSVGGTLTALQTPFQPGGALGVATADPAAESAEKLLELLQGPAGRRVTG